MRIGYSHCTHATPGQLDRYPFTRYEERQVEATLFRVHATYELEESFSVIVNGRAIGYGDTKREAIEDAQYRLMAESRAAAYRKAEGGAA
jgi:hypothetical protein